MEPFSLIHTPLKGINLIEASAGTGKTYAIEGLFLRLLLEKQILVEQILVVTFTQAATEELKDRVRNKIGKARDAFLKGQSDDIFINALIKKIKPAEIAVQLLQDALTDFDRASIFTIHGFCQRVLHENAFETGTLFDTELITDQTKLVREIADDFWRQHFYNAPPEFVGYALEKVKGPVYFARLLENTIPAALRIVPEAHASDLKSLPTYQITYRQLKTNWPLAQEQVTDLLKDPVLNGTVYGSTTASSSAKGTSKRALKVSAMAIQLERFIGSGSPGLPLFKEFEKFTTAKITASTRKGKRPPAHPFFDLCDELFTQAQALQKEMEAYLLFLKVNFFEYAASELTKRKTNSNVRFFDDLLLTLKDALDQPEGNILAESIRTKYRAALIDEFQDTDSTQYQIFSKLFSLPDSIFFMIGDPKQAIYSFRGADIFSYIAASQSADNKHTLSENWRSSPGLIKAVNTIFRNIPVPFVFDEISYIHTKPAHEKHPEEDDCAPLQLWFVSGNDESPLNKAEAIAMISNQLALEIIRILSEESDRFREGDIAILVRTNRQAQIVKASLAQKQIPSVLYYAGNVFETHEAMEMQKILLGISEPGSEHKLKAALATDIMGVSGEKIQSSQRDPQWWEHRNICMKEYFQLWGRHEFMRMFRFFMDREGVREKLLSLPDGERRLTNLLHLAEILHQESVESGPGIFGLIKWFSEQRKSSLPGSDTHQLRLESDAKAVKIVTIHKSKGLEYPIVFCPFAWEGIATRSETIRFHQPDSKILTVDLQPHKGSPNFVRAQNELLAESIRLLYVAVTRAKKRCYLVWGRFNSADTSAMMYLFHHGSDTKAIDRLTEMRQAFSEKNASDMLSDLKILERNSEGSIQTVLFPVKTEGRYAFQAEKFSQPFGRRFLGKIDTSWKISSYSSLISRQAPPGELPDHDAFFHS
jgi:exodeoxyribonuclease V beta subunit